MNSKEFLDKISSTFQTSVKLLKFNPLEQLSWDELEILYERGYNAWNEDKYEEATDIFAFLTLHKPLERE
ncbi:TPA: hypothetical protein ACNE4K_004961, partial [Escherichia coli]